METSIELTDEFILAINKVLKSKGDMTPLIEITSQIKLVNLDYWERLIREEVAKFLVPQSKWESLSRAIKSLFIEQVIGQVFWLGVVSWDGYEREKSLSLLSEGAPNAFYLTLIARRLNDWVPEVRAAARAAFILVASKTSPDIVAETIMIVLLNWNSWGHIEQENRKVILNLALRSDVALALKTRLITSASGAIPSLLSQFGQQPIFDDCLDEIAGSAIQPYVRAKAFRSLFEARMNWVSSYEWKWIDKAYGKRKLIPVIAERKIDVFIPLIELLNRSALDRSSIVRRVSAEFLIINLDHLKQDKVRILAERFVLDKSKAVSERGQFVIKKLNEKVLLKLD